MGGSGASHGDISPGSWIPQKYISKVQGFIIALEPGADIVRASSPSPPPHWVSSTTKTSNPRRRLWSTKPPILRSAAADTDLFCGQTTLACRRPPSGGAAYFDGAGRRGQSGRFIQSCCAGRPHQQRRGVTGFSPQGGVATGDDGVALQRSLLTCLGDGDHRHEADGCGVMC